MYTTECQNYKIQDLWLWNRTSVVTKQVMTVVLCKVVMPNAATLLHCFIQICLDPINRINKHLDRYQLHVTFVFASQLVFVNF